MHEDNNSAVIQQELCTYCGGLATVEDHVIPRSRGGHVTVPACQPCNSSKGTRTPNEWLISLWRNAVDGNPHRNLQAIHARHRELAELGLIDGDLIASTLLAYAHERCRHHVGLAFGIYANYVTDQPWEAIVAEGVEEVR